MTNAEQMIEVSAVKIANNFTEPGSQSFSWWAVEDLLGNIELPIIITFECHPPIREGEVVATMVYPVKGGGVKETEIKVVPRTGIVRFTLVPEAFGDVWIAVHYDGKLYFEDMFSIGKMGS